MKAFTLKNPKSVAQAIAELSDQWGRVDLLGGGTDLLSLMKEGLAGPETLVNLKTVEGLGGIDVGDDSIKIGATATLEEIARHGSVRKHLPALAEACEVIGGPQIRNMGTLGGSLCQRNRDWYFRLGLNPSIKEELQYGAIFPLEKQTYVHPSTTAPPLIAYGASVLIQGPGGERTIPIEKLFQVSDLKSKREITLAPNEVVRAVTIPVRESKSADYEVRERESHDWPLVQASVALTLSGDTVQSAAIVLGHVAPIPLRATQAEAVIKGKPLTLELAQSAGDAAAQGALPNASNAHKVTLTRVAVKRALLSAVGNPYWKART